MVALIKPRRKIFTGKIDAEQLADDFKNETVDMLKNVAREHNCNVEDLKFTVNNIGVVNIRNLKPEELFERDNNGQKEN